MKFDEMSFSVSINYAAKAFVQDSVTFQLSHIPAAHFPALYFWAVDKMYINRNSIITIMLTIPQLRQYGSDIH